MTIDLNEQERELLVQLLTAERGETSTEIHHAMDGNTRASLRAERALVEHLLQRLGATSPSAR